MQRYRVAAGLVGALAVFAAGCSTGQRAVGLDEGRAYPSGKAQQEVLNIQLIRDEASVSLTNTTARALGESVLWINQEFWYPISGLGVGETMHIELTEFRNEYGARFRAGGFFATERSKNVVLAQLEVGDDADSLLGIVVVNGAAGL